MVTCRDCPAQFLPEPYGKTGRKTTRCPKCRRVNTDRTKAWARRKRKPVEKPPGCEICGGLFGKIGPACYDHGHVSGLFRGWLCRACNIALGLFRDDPGLMERAATYVRQRGV